MRRLLLSLTVLLAGAAPAHAQLLAGIEPAESALTATAGGAAPGTWTVRNLGAEPARVRMRLADLEPVPDGGMRIARAGTTAASLSPHLRPEPAEFVLEPGDQRVVRLAGAVPDGGAAARSGILVAEMIPAALEGRWGLSPVPVGPGASIFLSRASARGAPPEIAGLRVRDAGALLISVRVWNGGERAERTEGEFVVRDSAGVEVVRGRLMGSVVMPRAPRFLNGAVTAPLPRGRYEATARVRTAGGEATALTEFRWPPAGPIVSARSGP